MVTDRTVRDVSWWSGKVISAPIRALVSDALNISLSGISRRMQYAANTTAPNVAPDPTVVIDLFQKGWMREEVASFLLKKYGIDHGFGTPSNQRTWMQHAWTNYIESTRPTLDPETARHLFVTGNLTGARLERSLVHFGITDPDDREAFVHYRPALGMSAAKQLWLSGWLSLDRVRASLNDAMVTDPDDVRAILDSREYPTESEGRAAMLRGYVRQDDYTEIVRRNGLLNPYTVDVGQKYRTPINLDQIRARYVEIGISDNTINAELGHLGYGRDGDRSRVWAQYAPHGLVVATNLWWRGEITQERRDDLYWYNGLITASQKEEFGKAVRPIPSAADLIRFAVKEAWDESVVRDFGYDAEFPTEFQEWMRAQGYAWSKDITLADGTVRPGVEWPKLWWRSHWSILSPTFAYEMYHRFRPGRTQRYAAEVPNLPVFGRDKLDQVLKINDYPPAVRDWLTALSYRKLDARSLRNVLKYGVRDEEWVFQQLQDYGYLPEDARVKIRQWQGDFRWQQDTPVRSLAQSGPRQVCVEALGSYADGLVTREQCREVMVRSGMLAHQADLLMQVEITKKTRKYIKAVVKQLERDFLLGATTLEEVAALLIRAGIQGEERTRLLQEWTLRKGMQRRIQSAAWVIGMVKRGLLSIPNAQSRLANLGWLAPDIALATGMILQDLSKSQAKLVTAADKGKLAAQKQLASAQKQAKTAMRQAQAELRRLYPKTDLKKWLQKGWRNEQWTVARLREQGYAEDWIQTTIRDWESAGANGAGAKGGKAPPSAPGGSSGSAP